VAARSNRIVLCFIFAEPRSLVNSMQCGPANCAALYTGLAPIGSSHRGNCPGNRRIRRDGYSSGSDEKYFVVPSKWRLNMQSQKCGAHSEKSVSHDLAVGTLRSSGGRLWTQIGCDEGKRQRTMRELEVPIGNSRQRVSIQLNQSSYGERERGESVL
jgi:hypothetical protein